MLIFARVIMSWFIRDLNNPIARFIYNMTEPILAPFRELLNKFGIGGMLDFSPILALLTLQVLSSIIISL
jgi:YggT family protein